MSVFALILLGTILLLAIAVLVLFGARRRRERAIERLWAELAAPAPGPEERFDAAMVDGLPEPARRWLTHAIAPGTPLRRVALLRMHGTMLLAEGKPLPMHADQVLAPPHGFIWRARVGGGLLRIRGFDRYARGTGEMRWWALGLIPAVTGTGPDIDRAAAGRLAGEAALVPAALLPGTGVNWEPVAAAVARARMQVDGEPVSFTVAIAPDGTLQRVVITRWNGDPRNGPVGYLPFAVDFEGEQRSGGYALPVRLRAGWVPPGGDASRPFFRAQLDRVDFR
ncbi:MAG: hypothetical protein FIB01_00600 [Gemmatimonadetes bacterium]|nr:hypothetical protein [Gemmatimonadota bacterium]